MTDKLNDNDKQRIEQEAITRFGSPDKGWEYPSVAANYFKTGAEYATTYEREQQKDLQKELEHAESMVLNLTDDIRTTQKQLHESQTLATRWEDAHASLEERLKDQIIKLEDERSELTKKINNLQLALNIATNPGRPNHDVELRNKVIELQRYHQTLIARYYNETMTADEHGVLYKIINEIEQMLIKWNSPKEV